MHKKRIAFAGLVAVTAMGFTACASGGSAADGGKTTIVWNMWAGDTASEQKLKDQMAVAQKLVGDDITIELQTAPWADYFTKLNTNMASGKVACVTGMNGQRLAGYTDVFDELTDDDLSTMGISRDAYNPGALSVMENGGKLYGLPYDTAAMLLFYNADLFAKAGAPLPTNDWTIDDFEKAASEITAKAGAKGFAVSVDEFQWLSLPMAETGLQPVDDSGALDLINPSFVEAATRYGDLVSKLGVSDAVPSASDSAWTTTQFENGKAAMIIEGTWMASTLTSPDLGFSAGAVRIPRGSDGAYGVALGSGYGIAANCENKEAALKVLGALSSPDVQSVIAQQGGYPAQLASQPEFFTALPDATRDNLTQAFTAAFEGAVSQRVTDQWTQVATAMPNELVSVYTGQATMSSVLDGLEQRFGK
jgi:multiple sugar transport system substrate-binding protein